MLWKLFITVNYPLDKSRVQKSTSDNSGESIFYIIDELIKQDSRQPEESGRNTFLQACP